MIEIDGTSLTIEQVMAVARDFEPVQITEDAKMKIRTARAYVDEKLAKKAVIYGLTTGFGKFCDTFVPEEETAALQRNLIFSHSCGMQEAAKIAGFEMTVPETVEGFADPAIEAVKEDMIQVSFAKGDDELLLRKALGTDDVSGDYNTYAETNTLTVGDLTVTAKGSDGVVHALFLPDKLVNSLTFILRGLYAAVKRPCGTEGNAAPFRTEEQPVSESSETGRSRLRAVI